MIKEKEKGRDSCNVFWKMERTNKRLLQREREGEMVLGAVNEQDTETMRVCWWAVRQL